MVRPLEIRTYSLIFPCADLRWEEPPYIINPLSANLTKWSNTLKRFVGKLPTNCLSVFDHFLGLAFKGLTNLTTLVLMTKTIKNLSYKERCNLLNNPGTRHF